MAYCFIKSSVPKESRCLARNCFASARITAPVRQESECSCTAFLSLVEGCSTNSMCATGHPLKPANWWAMKRLLYALSNNRLRFVHVLLFGVGVNAAFAAADPLVMKLMVDEGIIKKNFALFAGSAALVVLLG